MAQTTSSSAASGSLIFRNYGSFRGVDFSNRKDEIELTRSPDALNVWKNYRSSNGKCVETRPTLEKILDFKDINGMTFYNNKIVVHSGNSLYYEDVKVYENMANHKSNFFIYEKELYIKDGTNYLVFDGKTVKAVEGYIPTSTISRKASGGGSKYQDINLLTGLRRNQFCADGESTEYYLDDENIDNDYTPIVSINGGIIEKSEYTTDYVAGKIIFNTAPAKPLTDGQDNIVIQFKHEVSGAREKIEKCTLLEVFDNRVFFSGNPDYPNMLFHCSLDDPTYVSDTDYYTEGVDDSKIKSLVAGNNALWVLKEPGQTNTTIFYHTPTIDDSEGKIYPSTHSSISTGCVSKGINFNDTICFFSDRGLEAITGDVTTEQVLMHRSSLVDSKLLNEESYKELELIEWEGYLLVLIDNKVYLASSKEMFKNVDDYEYEWWYWKLSDSIKGGIVKDNILYLYSKDRIYTLTNNEENRKVESYFTTISDEMRYPQMWKSTNKKATVIDVEGKITFSSKKDNEEFIKIAELESKKGYVKPRIKVKKFKSIQLKFSSNTPFALYSCTLEAYLGNIVKR